MCVDCECLLVFIVVLDLLDDLDLMCEEIFGLILLVWVYLDLEVVLVDVLFCDWLLVLYFFSYDMVMVECIFG